MEGKEKYVTGKWGSFGKAIKVRTRIFLLWDSEWTSLAEVENSCRKVMGEIGM